MIEIKTIVDLFENSERVYETGMIVDFHIRDDMLNLGKIDFFDKEYVKSGEMNILAQITFAYTDLVLPFIKRHLLYFW